jgi:hypothetical protein
MTLDEKKEALGFIYMLVECYETGWDVEHDALQAKALELIDLLEKQNNDAIEHRDVTRVIQKKNPHATLAQCRTHATKFIKEHYAKQKEQTNA